MHPWLAGTDPTQLIGMINDLQAQMSEQYADMHELQIQVAEGRNVRDARGRSSRVEDDSILPEFLQSFIKPDDGEDPTEGMTDEEKRKHRALKDLTKTSYKEPDEIKLGNFPTPDRWENWYKAAKLKIISSVKIEKDAVKYFKAIEDTRISLKQLAICIPESMQNIDRKIYVSLSKLQQNGGTEGEHLERKVERTMPQDCYSGIMAFRIWRTEFVRDASRQAERLTKQLSGLSIKSDNKTPIMSRIQTFLDEHLMLVGKLRNAGEAPSHTLIGMYLYDALSSIQDHGIQASCQDYQTNRIRDKGEDDEYAYDKLVSEIEIRIDAWRAQQVSSAVDRKSNDVSAKPNKTLDTNRVATVIADIIDKKKIPDDFECTKKERRRINAAIKKNEEYESQVYFGKGKSDGKGKGKGGKGVPWSSGPPSGSKGKSKGKGKSQSQFDKSKIECWNCGKTGHFRDECPEPKKVNAIIAQDADSNLQGQVQSLTHQMNMLFSHLNSSSSSNGNKGTNFRV